MPGLAGIIGNVSKAENAQKLNVMIQSMMHEKFYNSGSYVNEEMGLYFGWVILKGSSVDCMPIWNERKNKCILFYGENFPHDKAIDDLRIRGHKFLLGDLSYLIHLYEELGDDFFLALNGFFCGIVIDLARNEVTLFNDRYGMQRIYYNESDGTFLFCSEAKALLKTCKKLREIDHSSLGQLLSMGCVLGDRTLFRNVKLLPGGHLWRFRKARCEERKRYFDRKEWENQGILNAEDFYGELRTTFRKIVPRYVDCREPVGVSLTGGLDTRLIMAYVSRGDGLLPCYTFGGMYHDSFDVKSRERLQKRADRSIPLYELGKSFCQSFLTLRQRRSLSAMEILMLGVVLRNYT